MGVIFTLEPIGKRANAIRPYEIFFEIKSVIYVPILKTQSDRHITYAKILLILIQDFLLQKIVYILIYDIPF